MGCFFSYICNVLRLKNIHQMFFREIVSAVSFFIPFFQGPLIVFMISGFKVNITISSCK